MTLTATHFYILASMIYIAPNLSSNSRLVAAALCIILSVFYAVRNYQ